MTAWELIDDIVIASEDNSKDFFVLLLVHTTAHALVMLHAESRFTALFIGMHMLSCQSTKHKQYIKETGLLKSGNFGFGFGFQLCKYILGVIPHQQIWALKAGTLFPAISMGHRPVLSP